MKIIHNLTELRSDRAEKLGRKAGNDLYLRLKDQVKSGQLENAEDMASWVIWNGYDCRITFDCIEKIRNWNKTNRKGK